MLRQKQDSPWAWPQAHVPPRAGGSFVIAFASGEHPQFPLCRAESFIRALVEVVALEEVCETYAKAPVSPGTPFPP